MLLKNVEILAEGTWPASETLTMSIDDIDGIVSSFNFLGLGGKIPLKLGHEGPDQRDDPASQYAMGWVQSIWRDGKKMMANFDLPQKVYNAIKEKMLKFNSVELLKNVQVGNRQIPWVLDAVALLGTDQPAVGVLREMQASIEARRTSLRSSGRVTLSSNGRKQTEVKKMDEKEIAALVAKSVGEAVKAALAPVEEKLKLAEESRIRTEVEAKKQRIDMTRATIDRLFNAGIEAKTLEPAVRERYVKLTKYDKSDEFVSTLDIKDVEEYIKENSKKVEAKKTTDAGSSGNEEEKGKAVGKIVYDRATKLLASRNQNVNDLNLRKSATVEVLKSASKALARAYTNGDQTYEEDAA